MTEEGIILKYKDSADRNFQTAQDLYNSGHYDWALFLGQLTLEKLLKGLVIKHTNEIAPFIHDLSKLSILAAIPFSDEENEWLIEITRYHIQARYDDIKYELYKKATKEYTDVWFDRIKTIYTQVCTHY
jgi:HEPN domain-containing protein